MGARIVRALSIAFCLAACAPYSIKDVTAISFLKQASQPGYCVQNTTPLVLSVKLKNGETKTTEGQGQHTAENYRFTASAGSVDGRAGAGEAGENGTDGCSDCGDYGSNVGIGQVGVHGGNAGPGARGKDA